MGRYYLDDDEKRIVRAIIHGDSKRRKRIQDGNASAFDRSAAAAVDKAIDEFTLTGITGQAREVITQKVIQSIADCTPYELIGETYCGRRQFYEHRRRFCHLVAVNMGILKRDRKRKGGRNG